MAKSNRPKKKTGSAVLIIRNAGFYFVIFFGLVLWAFWTSYFGKLGQSMETHIHWHGAAMTLWCLMLISQAFLIRWKQYTWHRWVGRSSYILVPFLLFSGVHIAQITIRQSGAEGTGLYYYLAALMFNALIVFAVLYGLAIWNRKTPALHARWMISTMFPLITPVTDRLIYKYIDGLVPRVPVIDGMTMVQLYGFGLGEIILLGLALWDAVKNKQYNVFPFVLGLLFLYHLSVITFHQFAWWRSIGDWMMRLPFS